LGLAYLGQNQLAEESLRPTLEALSAQRVTPSLRSSAAEALAAIYDRAGRTDEAARARAWAREGSS